MEKIRVFEAFSGIGTQYMALKRLKNNYPEFEFEVVGQSEIDKFALKSYKAIHGDIKNYGDIKEINVEELPEFDLFTYSFPCQDISIAGKLKGFSKDSNTRSSLLWECAKIIGYVKPKYLLMENVKNLVGKRFKNNFEEWLDYLNDLGYTNFYQVLNAKDYGVPQNRERVFCISILNSDIEYKFPGKFELETTLGELLLDEVDDKYYLPKERLGSVKLNESDSNIFATASLSTFKSENNITNPNKWARTIMARDYKGAQLVAVGYLTDVAFESRGRIFSKDSISPTLTTMQGGNTQPWVLSSQDITDKSIRRLTPQECWRVMGISDADFYKAQEVNSNSQLYKQAGNAIVVDVLYYLFRELFIKAGK